MFSYEFQFFLSRHVMTNNWERVCQLAIYKRYRGDEIGFTDKQLQLKVLSGTSARNP